MGKTTYLLMALAGIFGFSAGVTPTFKLLKALSAVGSSPTPATVAQAPVGRWVTLTDAKLRCDSRTVYKDTMTFFLATDAGMANPFVAQFLGQVECGAATATVSGAFVPDPLTLADLAQYGVDAKGASGLRLFTPLATPKYLRLALVPFVGILLIGTGIALFGLRGLLRTIRAERK
jgi:hypothetical protein